MAKRKKKVEEEAGADTFMMLFTTLSLILLAFFIFMKTLSTPDDDRERRALASIRRTFDWLKVGGIYADDTETVTAGPTISESEQSYRSLEQDLVNLVKQLSLGASNEVSISVNDDETRIRLAQEVLFRPTVTAINPRSFPVLDRMGDFLKHLDRDVIVEGHADPAGDAVNWSLSAYRAASVARYLDESVGVREPLIKSRGLAHYHPPGDEFTHARRVEIVVPNRRSQR